MSAMELEAESVAFVVMQHFGIDSGDYSFGYISHWAGAGVDMEPAIAQLKESGAKIQKAANEIIDALVAFEPMAIAPSSNHQEADDLFQIDLAEILAARRELVAA
jgi:hypothetical protein